MRVLVIGATGGIGAALAADYTARGAIVTGLSRRDGLDLCDEASIAEVLGALHPPFHRVIVATGALALDGRGPEKSLRELEGEGLAAQFALNATGPALVLKHARPLLSRTEPARFVALSARVGSIGDNELGGWYAYRAAKAALNQLLHTAAIELARSHPQLVVACLHPGHVETRLSAPFGGRLPSVPPAEAAARLVSVIEGLEPHQSGGFFDYAGQTIPW